MITICVYSYGKRKYFKLYKNSIYIGSSEDDECKLQRFVDSDNGIAPFIFDNLFIGIHKNCLLGKAIKCNHAECKDLEIVYSKIVPQLEIEAYLTTLDFNKRHLMVLNRPFIKINECTTYSINQPEASSFATKCNLYEMKNKDWRTSIYWLKCKCGKKRVW